MAEKVPQTAQAADPRDPLVGQVLDGRFTVLARLGSGGMGRVYQASQAPLGRLVALKVLNTDFAVDEDPAFAKRFFLEASVTSKLTHPNTITIIDHGQTGDGILYIAMEHLQGRTLHQTIAREGRLAAPRAVHIARQICGSLREAHALGIVHRDLKPANVMLVRHGDDADFVKVLDFGLVKFFSALDGGRDEPELTRHGTFLGSPTYMAPEQAKNAADPRSDVYSLGVVLYYLLAGKPPFQGASVEVILKHAHDAPPPFRAELEVPPWLEAVVMRALAKPPEARFQSMDDFLEALKRCDAPLPWRGGEPTTLAPPPSPPDRPAVVPPTPIMGQPDRSTSPRPSGETLRLREVLLPAMGMSVLIAAGVATVVVMVHRARRPALLAEPVATLAAPRTLAPTPRRRLRLHVESTPPGAEVRARGVALGRTPLETRLEFEGDEAVPALELSLEGFVPAAVAPSLAGDALSAAVELERVAPAPKPAPPKIKRPPRRPSHLQGYKDDPY